MLEDQGEKFSILPPPPLWEPIFIIKIKVENVPIKSLEKHRFVLQTFENLIVLKGNNNRSTNLDFCFQNNLCSKLFIFFYSAHYIFNLV